MLGLAKYHGWPTEFYARSDHPVQQRCLKSVSEYTDVALKELAWPWTVAALPVRASLAQHGPRVHSSRRSNSRAMTLHPELIAGEGRPCTEIMRAHPARVVAKVGAEGVYSALLIPREARRHAQGSRTVTASRRRWRSLGARRAGPQAAAGIVAQEADHQFAGRRWEMRVNGGLSR